MNPVTRLAVCGLGKLGLPIAAVFAASGVPTIGFDIDVGKVRIVANGNRVVAEPDVTEYLALDEVGRNLKATEAVEEAVAASDACVFVTPTPSRPDGGFDHHYLLSAVVAFAQEAARQRRRRYLFVVTSTVMPGTCEWEVTPLLRRFLGPYDPQLAYKPELIALGTVVKDLHNPDLLLIGEATEEAGDRVEALYRQMVFGAPPAKRLSLAEAELAKISLNCAVTMKISFANQVGALAEKLGARPGAVLDAVGADPRIGAACLRPGLPYGGPCFPRDNRMFQHVARQLGVGAPLAIATDVVNRSVVERVLARALATHGDVGILGLTYKPGTPVIEDAPGTIWKDALKKAGRRVRAHDVMAPHAHTIEEVLACPTVIVATAWPEYAGLAVPEATTLFDPFGIVARRDVLALEAAG